MLTIAAASTIPDAQTKRKDLKDAKKKKVSYIIKAIGKKEKKIPYIGGSTILDAQMKL